MFSRKKIPVILCGCLMAATVLAACASGSRPDASYRQWSASMATPRTGSTQVLFLSKSAQAKSQGGMVVTPRPAKSPFILVQSTGTTPPAADATSSASVSEEKPAEADATSSATATAAALQPPESCLVCHGPFEELAKKTADYVTDWDEKANPHVYVPHDSKTIVTCTDCHEVHAIPVTSAESIQKPTVQYCYSCHHAETLVNCNTCHKE